jgi:hypothetical protein
MGYRVERTKVLQNLGLKWPGSPACAEASPSATAEVVTRAHPGRPYRPKRSLVLPEIAEPLGRMFAISNRMLDVLVAEIVLQRPSIHTLIGQLEPS